MTFTVSMTNFNNNQVLTPEQREKRKEAGQKVAAGTGVTGAAAYQAKRTSVNNTLKSWFSNLTTTTRTARQNATEVTGLYSKFKQNVKFFSSSLVNKAMKLQDIKFIGPIVKSPFAKGICSTLGVGMAFFALVTGIDKAYRNGKFAVNDLKGKFNLAM